MLILPLRVKAVGAGKGSQTWERQGQDEHREMSWLGKGGLGRRLVWPHGGGEGERWERSGYRLICPKL